LTPLCSSYEINYGFAFFFQAEDGIRDRNVTGVQTCALPIYCCWALVTLVPYSSSRSTTEVPELEVEVVPSRPPTTPAACSITSRSEERRVGKEGRARRGTKH